MRSVAIRKHIFILDRNAVIEANRINNGEISGHEKDLRSIDMMTAIVSPLLSAMEGKVQGKRNPKSMRVSFDEEAEIINKFFKLARTDYDILKKIKRFIPDVHEELNKKINIRQTFLKYFYYEFKDAASKKNAKNEYDRFRNLMEECKQPYDRFALICVACLFNSEAARGVLKPQQKVKLGDRIYNALADIEKIELIPFIEAKIKRISYPPLPIVKFISFDKNLMELMRLLNPINCKLNDDGISCQIDLSNIISSMINIKDNDKLRSLIEENFMPNQISC